MTGTAQSDALSQIPMRRADTDDTLVIEIGATPETSLRLSLSKDRGLNSPRWFLNPDADVTQSQVLLAVALRIRAHVDNVPPKLVWQTCDTELQRRRREILAISPGSHRDRN